MSDFYGVVGHPIGHSLSPLIHTMLFEYYNLDCKYEKYDIAPENFEKETEKLFKFGVKGLNVTIPDKIAALESVDCVDPYALCVRAVNTIRFDGSKTYGYNTDGIGFIKALNKFGVSVKDKNILILGAGGAVNSVAKKSQMEGAKKVTILARDINKAKVVAERLDTDYGDLADYEKYDYDILVNATPVGMYPKTGASVISSVKTGSFVYDLIYNPETTRLMEIAHKCGAKAENGLWMLIYQAFESFRIWHNIEPDEIIAEKIYIKAGETLNGK